MKPVTDASLNTLNETLKHFCSEDRNPFYLSEFVEEAKVTLQDAENFFLPLLEKGKIEGRLEVRCPSCGKDIQTYERMSQIPDEIDCEICSYTFSKSLEFLEVILEVRDKFFRCQLCPKSTLMGNQLLSTEKLRIPTKKEVHQLLRDAIEEEDTSKKGWKFETFFENVMKREKDFSLVYKHPRSKMGEIDYVYSHTLQGHYFWSKRSTSQ